MRKILAVFPLLTFLFLVSGCTSQTALQQNTTIQPTSNPENTMIEETNSDSSDIEEAQPMPELSSDVDADTATEVKAVDKIFDNVDANDFSSSNLDEIE